MENIVFNKKWFEKYQKRLLWLLNAPIIKYWFRWCMRIRKCDCPSSTKINQIMPNAFSYGAKKVGKNRIQLTTDFRTHDKYAKRMYYAFKPFWYLLHFFDWVALDRFEQLSHLNFGFLTLTQFPGSIGSGNPADGQISVKFQAGNYTWPNLIISTGDGSDASDPTSLRIGSATSSGKWNALDRCEAFFNTAALTSSAVISAPTTLSLYGTGQNDALAVTPNLDIYVANPSSTSSLTTSDWQNMGSTSQTGSPIAYASWVTSSYNDFTLNVYTNISKTGVSTFGIRNANYDVAATSPTWSSGATSSFQWASAAHTGTTHDPKLVVTYTIVTASGNMMMCF